jgi:hypothetical protein
VKELYTEADRVELRRRMNSPDYPVRMTAADEAGRAAEEGTLKRSPVDEVNNHVHTTYSFSPYEPAMAAFTAWEAGLQIVGSMDHDSIGAASEMRRAAAAVGIAATVGFELRCSFGGTQLAGRMINNPDTPSAAYMCVHGVPPASYDACRKFLKPINRARGARSRAMTEAMNLQTAGLDEARVDYDTDVLPLTRVPEGGSVTERHLLAALADALIARIGRGERLLRALEQKLGVACSGRVRQYLLDTENPHYRYDLLGVLKSGFLPRFFLQPKEQELPPAEEVVRFAESAGAIAAYAYLGDVTDSPTGDKQAQQFEDSYLDELFVLLRDLGFRAVTYMPPRNTRAQLQRVKELAGRYGLMEISGVDINSSRQSFRCPELLDPQFIRLLDSAWALVAHEVCSEADPRFGLFHPENPFRDLPLAGRIERYSAFGRALDVRNPQTDANTITRSMA